MRHSCGPLKEHHQGCCCQAYVNVINKHNQQAIVFKNTTLSMSKMLGNLQEYDVLMYNRNGKHSIRVDEGSELDNKRECSYNKENDKQKKFDGKKEVNNQVIVMRVLCKLSNSKCYA